VTQRAQLLGRFALGIGHCGALKQRTDILSKVIDRFDRVLAGAVIVAIVPTAFDTKRATSGLCQGHPDRERSELHCARGRFSIHRAPRRADDITREAANQSASRVRSPRSYRAGRLKVAVFRPQSSSSQPSLP